jgi:hypothetical protein
MLNPENFPRLLQAARHPEPLVAALAVIRQGVEAGQIRNVALADAKFTLNRGVEEVWKQRVDTPFFFKGKFEHLPQEIHDLYFDIKVYGVHDVLAASRKLAKVTARAAVVDVMRALLAELLPLAEAVAGLKDKVVKGRAPRTAPAKAANPNKDVKTCPCCFRPIAVVAGTMAHHGYRRPGHGSQTASCPGVRFPPLEVSTEGLAWLIEMTRNSLNDTRAALAKKDTITTLPKLVGQKLVDTKLGDPNWAVELQRHVARLEQALRWHEADLKTQEVLLVQWTAKLAEDPSNG